MAAVNSVLIVEDNDALREIITDYLNNNGFTAKAVDCAEELDVQFSKHIFDVVILDLNLPGEDGLSIAKRLRQSHPKIGIVIFTARTATEDKIEGYEAGADIYLTKPVANLELLAAVNSLARRMEQTKQTKRSKSKWSFSAKEKTLKGPLGQCTMNEADSIILNALSTSKDQMVEYWQLLELLNLSQSENAKSNLEVKVVRLRKKLEDIGAEVGTIKSLRNKGYQLTITLTHD